MLLIESDPGVGATDAELLAAAGHRVHRCYPVRDPEEGHVPLRDRHLCLGVTEGLCPLRDGVDVALLVRRRAVTRPTAAEAGVSCALRAGVPVVEDGPDLLDPYEPWLAGRVDHGDVVASCERVVDADLQRLHHDIARRIGPVCDAAGLTPDDLRCRFETDGTRLRVVLTGPTVGRFVEQALAVRVLDAVRGIGRTFGQVDVGYEARTDG